jgi:hypothetical protein
MRLLLTDAMTRHRLHCVPSLQSVNNVCPALAEKIHSAEMRVKTNMKYLRLLPFSIALICAFDVSAQSIGFIDRAAEIRSKVLDMSATLDANYNFERLSTNGVLPPAIGRADSRKPVSIDSPCGESSVCALVVIAPARSLCVESPSPSCEKFNWRHILFDGLPEKTEALASSSASENRSGSDADAIFDRNLERLESIYIGMTMYRRLKKNRIIE